MRTECLDWILVRGERYLHWMLTAYVAHYNTGRPHRGQPKGGKARTVVIPPPLVAILKAHRAAQRKARMAVGQTWEDWDLVFARPDGRPIDPSDDWAEWKRLAKTSGVRESRPHDARHTAATVLLEQGVDIRVVQQVLGHSTLAVTRRYTHVTDRLATDAAERMGRALWDTTAKATATGGATGRRRRRDH